MYTSLFSRDILGSHFFIKMNFILMCNKKILFSFLKNTIDSRPKVQHSENDDYTIFQYTLQKNTLPFPFPILEKNKTSRNLLYEAHGQS